MKVFGNSPVKKREITLEDNIRDTANEVQWRKSSRNVGIDLGYGYVKILNGQNAIRFPSVVGVGKELGYKSLIDLPKDELEELIVKLGDEYYFVGDLAVRQSNLATRSLDQHRPSDNNAKILLLTALGLLNKWEDEEFNLITGLPVSYYSKFKNEWAQTLADNYNITFVGDKVDKKKRFVIKEVELLPQPFGTLYDKLLNDAGKVADRELADMIVGIIDIGYKTSDFAVSDQMELIEHMSFSNTNALSSAYRIIANQLREDYGIEKESYELDDILERGWVRVAGKRRDISGMKKEVYQKVAGKIVTEINSSWDYKDFDVILLTGGGGQALSEYILPEYPNMQLVESPQFANVRGYQKLAKKVFEN